MEQLTPAQKTAVTKSSSDRLRLYLFKAGYEEEVVLGWTREELMSNYAELLVRGTTGPEAVAKSVDPALEKARFEHEEKMKQMEMEMRKAEIAAEKERSEAAERLEKTKLETERERTGLERMKLQHEKDLKRVDMDAKEKVDQDVVKQLKRFGEALSQVVGPQPDEITDLPSYFQGVEAQFQKLKVPKEYQARLMYKYLSARSRALCTRMEPDVRDNYDQMKEAILKEYGLTAKCFLDKFNTVKKSASETFVLFSSKLKGLLNQYVASRDVTDFDNLVSLLISDRIKSTLTEHCLKHVLSVESTLGKPFWLEPTRLVQVIDEYMSNLGTSLHVTSSFIGQGAYSRRFSVQNTNQAAVHNDTRPDFNRVATRFHDPSVVSSNKAKRCFICGSLSHLRAQCDRVRVNVSTADRSRDHHSSLSGNQAGARPIVAASQPQPVASDRPLAGVNKVAVATAEQLVDQGEGHLYSGCGGLPCFDSVDNVSSCDMEKDDYYTDGIIALFADLDDADITACSRAKTNAVNFSERFDIHRIVADCQAVMHYVELDVVDVCGNVVKINSLFDSGTQISILKADAVHKLSYTLLGKVTLQTFDNRVSTGDLVSFDVRLDGGQKYHPIQFVVCDNVSHDCLLSLADYRKLLDLKLHSTESTTVPERCVESTLGVASVDNGTINDADSNQLVDVDSDTNYGNDEGSDDNNDDVNNNDYADITSFVEPCEVINPDSSQVGELINEQTCDKSLSSAFALARNGKGGYFLRSGLLFHRAQIQGKDVDRLVVPVGRRLALLNLAHDQVGCHMGIRKTKQRIGLSFSWPALIRDVIDYCKRCEVCQKRARVTYRDRVPIEGGVVSTEPVFSHFYVDCLGPLFNTKVAYNYALVFLDKTSRFPHAVPLSSLSAKTVVKPCCLSGNLLVYQVEYQLTELQILLVS